LSETWIKRSCAVVAAAVAAPLIAGCGLSTITSGLSTTLFDGDDDRPADVAQLSAANQAAQLSVSPASGVAMPDAARACPKTVIGTTGRTLTNYEPGREGDSLGIVHRGELMKTGRECALAPGQIRMRYGVFGRVLLGPVGQAGSVSLPVKVTVLDANNQPVANDSFALAVTTQDGKPIEYFSQSRTIEFSFPMGVRPADYQLVVQFDNAASS